MYLRVAEVLKFSDFRFSELCCGPITFDMYNIYRRAVCVLATVTEGIRGWMWGGGVTEYVWTETVFGVDYNSP
jgi:hypothetical protein